MNRLLTVFLENALVYSDDVIDVSLEETTTERQLTIQDRGIGIASNQQTKIFERFYRGTIRVTEQEPVLGYQLLNPLRSNMAERFPLIPH